MKNILKKLFVPMLASSPIATLGNLFFGCGVPIFVIHRITTEDHSDTGKITPGHLRECLDYLTSNDYTLISLEQLILALKNNQKLPSKAVVFTIDDGFHDQAEIAAPVFLEFNCPLTIFLITGMLDQNMWPWDAKVSWIIETTTKKSLDTNINSKTYNLSLKDEFYKSQTKRLIHNILRGIESELLPEIINQLAIDAAVSIPITPPEPYTPMSWEMARNLECKGIQFAPHTVTHNILSKLKKESMEIEIDESWAALKRELVNPIKIFCYPTGRETDFSSREMHTLKNSGFLGAVSTTPDYVTSGSNSGQQLFSLPRFSLPNTMTDFIQYCTWIEYAKNRYRDQLRQT